MLEREGSAMKSYHCVREVWKCWLSFYLPRDAGGETFFFVCFVFVYVCVCLHSEWLLRLGCVVRTAKINHVWCATCGIFITEQSQTVTHACNTIRMTKMNGGDMVSWGWTKSQLPQGLLFSTTTHTHKFPQWKIATILSKVQIQDKGCIQRVGHQKT